MTRNARNARNAAELFDAFFNGGHPNGATIKSASLSCELDTAAGYVIIRSYAMPIAKLRGLDLYVLNVKALPTMTTKQHRAKLLNAAARHERGTYPAGPTTLHQVDTLPA